MSNTTLEADIMTRITSVVAALAGAVIMVAVLNPAQFAAAGNPPVTKVVVTNKPTSPVPIIGTTLAKQSGTWSVDIDGTPSVSVSNLPATQPVSGTVNVGNLPATQPVSGTVNVGNFPLTQTVSGNVSVANFPASPT